MPSRPQLIQQLDQSDIDQFYIYLSRQFFSLLSNFISFSCIVNPRHIFYCSFLIKKGQFCMEKSFDVCC